MGCGEVNPANTAIPQTIQAKQQTKQTIQWPKQQPKQPTKQQPKLEPKQEPQSNFLSSIVQFNNVVKGIAEVGTEYNRKRPPKPSKQDDPLPFYEQDQVENSKQKKSFNKAQLYHPQSSQAQGLLKILKTKENQRTIFNKAEQLYKKKKYSEALELYQKINIEDSYIYTQRGYCNYQLQNYDEAVQGFNKSLQLKSDFLPTYFRLGRVYIYQHQNEKALEMFQKCLQSCKHTQIYYQLGLSTYYLLNYEESIEFYKKGLQLSPKNPKLISAIADSYYYNQQYEQSLDWYKKALQIQPKNAQTVSNIGQCLYNLQNYVEAQEWHLKSIEMDPNKAEFYYRLGLSYYWQEMYDQAINQYQKCIEMDPQNENYCLEIGNCKRFQLCYDEAFVWYKKALKINNQNPQIYLNMAIGKDESQQWKDAIGLCKKALKIDPQYTYAYIELGDCYFQTDEYETAIENYLQGIEKKTKNLAYCNFMIAKCYFYNEQHLNAIQYFQKAIQIDPEKIIYLVYLGKCLLQIQNFAESFEAFNKAKQLYEASPDETQEYDQEQFMIAQINQFIEHAEEWKQKKKIGYISPQDKEEIRKMRKNFQKRYKAIFGLQNPDDNAASFKPLDKKFLEVTNLIYKDKFLLNITDFVNSNISKIATYVRSIYDYDAGSFQIFAYIFQAFMWIQKFQNKKSIMQIEKSLYDVLQLLSNQYPPIFKNSSDLSKSITFPTYKEIKLNLFKDIVYFQSYDVLVHQIENINQRAKQDLPLFKQFVYTLQKNSNGTHAKVGMKLPYKKQDMSQIQKQNYQQKLFKVLMRIFQKMFKEVIQKKNQLLKTIDDRIKSNKKIPLYTVNQIIMNTWIDYINQILRSRKDQGVKSECYITDLVRGKCMFGSIQTIKNAVDRVVQLCKEKGYQIMELDNRLNKRTQDIVFKIRIKEVVSELQLVLEFDTVTFEFNHNFYEIMRCPLGCIFGSSLLLTKDVSESFLKQVANAMAAVKNIKPVDKQSLQSLEFVMNSFKQSSQFQRR